MGRTKTKPVGRPPTFTDEEVVIAAVKETHGLMYLAAQKLGIHYITLRQYAKKWPAVQQAMYEARGWRLDKAINNIDKALENGDVDASFKFLDRKGHVRGWGKQYTHNHQAPNGGAIQHAHAHIAIPSNAIPPELADKILEHLPVEWKEQRLLELEAEEIQLPKPIDAAPQDISDLYQG